MKLSLGAKLYIWIVGVIALLAVVYIAPDFLQKIENQAFGTALVIFTILVIISEIYEVELVYGRNTSTGIAICLAMILLGGSSLALPVTLIGTLIAEIILRWGRIATGLMNFIYRVSFNTGQFVISTFIGYLVFNELGGQELISFDNLAHYNLNLSYHIIPAIAAFVAYAIANTLFVSGILTLFEKTAFTYHLRFNLRHLLVQVLSLGALGILMAVVYDPLSPLNLLLVLVPLGLAHISMRNYMKLRHEATKTFQRISEMLDARDRYTYEHSQGVADLAEKLARKLQLHQEQIDQIKSAAVIHDIGKVTVPDQILRKPGPLTNEEWIIMKKHPDAGADLLKDLEMYKDVIEIVRCEHEHWDGSGYPKGLKAEEIPLGARIVAAADIYHALTTDRPYRPAHSHKEALQIIQQMCGVELDPEVVEALLSVLETSEARLSPPTKKTTAP